MWQRPKKRLGGVPKVKGTPELAGSVHPQKMGEFCGQSRVHILRLPFPS